MEVLVLVVLADDVDEEDVVDAVVLEDVADEALGASVAWVVLGHDDPIYFSTSSRSLVMTQTEQIKQLRSQTPSRKIFS